MRNTREIQTCRNRIMHVVVYCLSLALLSGCCFYRPGYPEYKDSAGNTIPKPPLDTVKAVDDYAEKIKTEYQNFLDRVGGTGFSLGILLIPMSAATLGLGIAGAATTTITSMALSSATIFGLGQWIVNNDKMRVYRSGYTALECLKTTSKPLHAADDEFTKVKTDEISDRLNVLNKLTVTIDGLISKASSSTLQTDAREALKHASTAKTHAVEAVRQFEQGHSKAKGLLIDYENAVTKVDGQTRVAATNTDQSLASLKGQLSTLKTSLSDWGGAISSASNGQKAADDSTNKKNGITTFTTSAEDQSLKSELGKLDSVLEQIKTDLTSIETASSELASLPVINYDPCISILTTAIAAPAELQVSPMTFEIKQGQTNTLTVVGGTGQYFADIIGATGTLPTFSTSASKGQVTKIDVITSSATTIAQYKAVIRDSSPTPQSKIIQITVKAP